MTACSRARAQLFGLVELRVHFSGETVTIPERSVRTVAFVGEARLHRAAAVAGVVMLAGWIIAVVLAGLDHQLSAGNVTTSAGFAVFAGVGVVVALHQPRNPVGWLLISFTFFFMLGIDAQEYAVYCYLLGHRLPFASAAVVVKQSANFAFFLLPLAVFLFPDGRLTSPRWWWVPDAGLRDRDRAADRRVCRAGPADHAPADVLLLGLGGRVYAGGGGAVQPAATAGAAHGGPAIQPGPLRRRPDCGRFRRPAQGRGRPGLGPHRPGSGGAGDARTRARLGVDEVSRRGPGVS
jgi:hypothetical protein